MGNCHEPFLGEGDAATCSLLPDKSDVIAAKLDIKLYAIADRELR